MNQSILYSFPFLCPVIFFQFSYQLLSHLLSLCLGLLKSARSQLSLGSGQSSGRLGLETERAFGEISFGDCI
jgi:hypothetical protein